MDIGIRKGKPKFESVGDEGLRSSVESVTRGVGQIANVFALYVLEAYVPLFVPADVKEAAAELCTPAYEATFGADFIESASYDLCAVRSQ